MFEEYRLQVLQDFDEKKKANQLSLNLMHMTAAKLKKACISVCEERYLKKDEQFLHSFFGKQPDENAYRKAISTCDPDMFKPLNNFLKNNTGGTQEKNIELLAWLIDFKPRPYQVGYDYNKKFVTESVTPPLQKIDLETQPVEKLEEKTVTVPAIEQIPVAAAHVPHLASPNNKKVRITVLSVLLLLVVITAIYIVPVFITHKNVLTGKERCMYWAGDHYQPITCGKTHGDTVIIPLDAVKLARLKKITDTRMIDKASIGKIWYAKIGNRVEFYTAGGPYPPDTMKRLKPLTEWILNKYVPHP